MFKSNVRGFVVLVVGLAVAAPPVRPQEAVQSEREAMYYRYLEFASYVKGGSIEPHWMADGSTFWYAEGAPANTVIWKVDPANGGTKTPLFDTARLRKALTPLLRHEPPYQGLPFETFTFVDGEKAVKFTVESKEFILQLDTYGVTRAPALSEEEKSRMVPRRLRDVRGISATEEVLSPDGRWFVTLKGHNVWLRSTVDGSEVQLTSDGVKDYEWILGWGDTVKWSRDSSTLAVKKADYRRVPRIPLVHWLGSTEEVEWYPFARKPGLPIAHVELSLIDIRSQKRVRVDTGEEPDQNIHLLEWLPDGTHLLFFRSRAYDPNLELVVADSTTGSTRVVLTEGHPVPVRRMFTRPFTFTLLEDGTRFLWVSRRTGWKHLYLYDLAGHLIRQLTQGEFPVERVVAVDEKSGWVYFTAQSDPQRPYDIHLCRVSLEGKGFTQLTETAGQHRIQFAPSGQFFLDAHSSVDRAPVVEVRRADGKLLQTLATANVDALKELHWTPPEEFVVKAADGKTDLYGVLYKPHDFDANKKYPVLLYAGAVVVRTFTGSGERETQPEWPQAMAQLGFITFTVDVREPLLLRSRGGEFDRVTAGTIGRYEVPDYVAALKGLAAERSYMDLSRVGVSGGSYGGYHAIRAMLQAPDIFHVGVAVAAITDSYGHPNFFVLGSPQSNKEAFEEASNLPLAGNLKGKLLLVHGTHDISVPFSHAMKMVDALTRAGKSYDLIVLPEWDHWGDYWGAQNELFERYRLEAIRRYFQEHLKP